MCFRALCSRKVLLMSRIRQCACLTLSTRRFPRLAPVTLFSSIRVQRWMPQANEFLQPKVYCAAEVSQTCYSWSKLKQLWACLPETWSSCDSCKYNLLKVSRFDSFSRCVVVADTLLLTHLLASRAMNLPELSFTFRGIQVEAQNIDDPDPCHNASGTMPHYRLVYIGNIDSVSIFHFGLVSLISPATQTHPLFWSNRRLDFNSLPSMGLVGNASKGEESLSCVSNGSGIAVNTMTFWENIVNLHEALIVRRVLTVAFTICIKRVPLLL